HSRRIQRQKGGAAEENLLMITLNCPSCGAAVNFHSKASVFAVCSFCKSTLVRQDMNLEMLGKMAELQDDMSPIQIGTSGFFGGRFFDVIGRLKVFYSEGIWNEWYTIFDDGKEGWLAEAQGFFAMCFPVENSSTQAPAPRSVATGVRVMLKPYGEFLIDD